MVIVGGKTEWGICSAVGMSEQKPSLWKKKKKKKKGGKGKCSSVCNSGCMVNGYIVLVQKKKKTLPSQVESSTLVHGASGQVWMVDELAGRLGWSIL